MSHCKCSLSEQWRAPQNSRSGEDGAHAQARTRAHVTATQGSGDRASCILNQAHVRICPFAHAAWARPCPYVQAHEPGHVIKREHELGHAAASLLAPSSRLRRRHWNTGRACEPEPPPPLSKLVAASAHLRYTARRPGHEAAKAMPAPDGSEADPQARTPGLVSESGTTVVCSLNIGYSHHTRRQRPSSHHQRDESSVPPSKRVCWLASRSM